MIHLDEAFYLDNLCDSAGVSLRETLKTLEDSERWKQMIFAHAKELTHLYNLPGQRQPVWKNYWNGNFGLLYYAKTRSEWLAAPKYIQDECNEAHTKALEHYWKETREAKDWREAKEHRELNKFWRFRSYDLSNEIHGLQYDSPAVLI